MIMVKICVLAIASWSSLALAQIQNDSKPILKVLDWQGGSQLISKETDMNLTDIFGYDAFDSESCATAGCESGMEVSNQRQVCVVGDLNQVCSLFSKLSKNAVAEYDGGLHELTTLTGCFAVKGPQVARLQLESRHDWESLRVGGTIDIARCE
jgi:hypothetical protein